MCSSDDENDFTPTTMEFARIGKHYELMAAAREKAQKAQRRIDEVKTFLPQPYQNKYNLK